jgi:hypothetical protein
VFCIERLESSAYLFLHFDFSSSIWYDIFRWLGVVFAVPLDLFVLFESLSGAARSKKARNGFMLIWDVKLWVIWRTRNEKMFVMGTLKSKFQSI